MFDILLPQGKLLGVKEFFLHLFTITIGLFIALSLEGWVEYRHHQHLAHEAEDGLRAEIANNALEVVRQRQMIIDDQKKLEADLKILAELKAHPHSKMGHIDLSVSLGDFDDMAWKNAQNTGALAFMPYKDAQSFSDIGRRATRPVQRATPTTHRWERDSALRRHSRCRDHAARAHVRSLSQQ